MANKKWLWVLNGPGTTRTSASRPGPSWFGPFETRADVARWKEVNGYKSRSDKIPVGNRHPGQKFTMDDGTTVTTELVEFFPSKGLKGVGSKLKRVRNAMLKKSCSVLRFETSRSDAAAMARQYRASTNPGVRVFVVNAKTMSKTDWGRRLTDMWGDGTMPGKAATHAVVACKPRRKK